MYRIILLLALAQAQSSWCGTPSLTAPLPLLQELPPSFLPDPTQARQHTPTCTPSRYIIPVVFHVIYSSSQDSIAADRIWRQMLRVFEDFRRVPETEGYSDAGVDTEVEFSLATKDPQGNPTSGVVYWRYNQPPLNWSSPNFCRETQDASMKQATAWDQNRYLNIWIVPRICTGNNCSDCGSIAGYAYFPFTPGPVYGAVVGAPFFWGAGGGRSGRTLVHELGHNLFLAHPFEGGCGGNCSSTGDGVCDTPPTAVRTGNFVVARQNTCTNDPPPDRPDNMRNYMDYVSDANMTYFSAGQRQRIWWAIQNSNSRLRPLTNPDRPQLTGTGAYGYLKAYFTARPQVGCAGLPIQFFDYSLGVPQQFSWTFQGGQADDPTSQCPLVTYSQRGTYDVQLVVQNLSGRKDTLLKRGYIQIHDTLYSLPYEESFEGTAFPPAHSYVENPDRRITWTRFRSSDPPMGAYGRSSTSLRLSFFTYSHYKERDSWVTPPLDFRVPPDKHILLRFSWAYACLRYWDSTRTYPSYPLDYTDTLRVLISTDCGRNWSPLWTRGGRTLSTHPDSCLVAPGSTAGTIFLPSESTWQTATIVLDEYRGLAPIRLRFEGISGWGNNLYLDDIKVELTSTLPTPLTASKAEWRLWVADQRIYISLPEPQTHLNWAIYDLQGRLLHTEFMPWLAGGVHAFALPATLPAGVYLIHLYSPNRQLSLRYAHHP
ncbi:MAG: M43 family zinc metalloprotease [Bacteroidia bacterium]|nr:M43 family zinc metalloprotease [Bacteroidia bacterium]MDW8089321.1 M43 family zinc metalloprotease [Bacteroidia bacterium]